MRIFVAQTNPTVGDVESNASRILEVASEANSAGSDLTVFPELSLCGYPPRDLLDRRAFLDACEAQAERIVLATAEFNSAVVFGRPRTRPESVGKPLANSLVVAGSGQVIHQQDKVLLPTYDVFDEVRYFEAGPGTAPLDFRGRRIGFAICEDVWNDKQFWDRPLYGRDPVQELVGQGADLLITINASPYHLDKRRLRQEMFAAMARRHGLPVVYCAQVGGNDQLLFDGTSFAMSPQGEVVSQAASFREDLFEVCWNPVSVPAPDPSDEHEAAYSALVMGTRDYLRKCGFTQVLIGLSGGIDSSLTACIAVAAVGAPNVIGVAMPGPYSSDHSLTDAQELASNLGIRFEVIPIRSAYQEMVRSLAPAFAGRSPDVTEENLQSRLRGMTLMALSNKFGAIVLTTGNKSELAVGYCTLYGDMCGGLAVISDVPKVMVYELCRVANRLHHQAIPENVFRKPPSAELRPDQKDSDSLPEYDVLDAILEAYVEQNVPLAAIANELGLDLGLVRSIARKVDVNEYKRQQAAPGLRITSKAFGMGRRYPIAQRFRE